MRYPYDPELAAALTMMAEVDITDLAAARAAQAREVAARLTAVDTTGVTVTELHAPGPADAPDVRLRLYRPDPAPCAGPLPVLYSLHGGGYVLGSPDVDHETNLRLCRDLGVLVVSPDYRLAPEHPYPAALEDCYAGLCLLEKGATELGLRPDRIAVCGDSAGAGLAAALTLLSRDRGGPSLCFQYLCSPALDDRLITPSAVACTDTPVWNRRNAELSWWAYLGEDAGSDDVPVYAAPGRADASQLADLPPALVTVMHFDPLRDEGIHYAQALLAAGVLAELHVYPGTFHGAVMVEHAAVVRRATQEATAALRRALWP
jgi:acetyl esterase/lipase